MKCKKVLELLGRDELWSGLGLDWIRIIANFVGFGLDPDCKFFQEFWIQDRNRTKLLEKICDNFSLKSCILLTFRILFGLGLCSF